jgi:Periplasmic copper-binding protein (NosD)
MKKHVMFSLLAAGLTLLSAASANAWSVSTNVPATAAIPGGAGFTTPFIAGTPGGTYWLAADRQQAFGNAIVVTADEVTIDLNGKTLAGAGPNAFQVGILVLGHNDVIVQQGNIDNFAFGIFWFQGPAGKNAKNRVEDVNFNNNETGVMSLSGTSNWVKQCVIDGGDVGVFLNDDIGSRVSHCIFEEQQASQSVGVGTGILTVASRGNLFDENLIARATTSGANVFGIIGSRADKVRFDSFVNYPIFVPIFGPVDLFAQSAN